MVVDSEKLTDRWMDRQTKDKQEAIRKATSFGISSQVSLKLRSPLFKDTCTLSNV